MKTKVLFPMLTSLFILSCQNPELKTEANPLTARQTIQIPNHPISEAEKELISKKLLPAVINQDSFLKADITCDDINDIAVISGNDEEDYKVVLIEGPISKKSNTFTLDVTDLQDHIHGSQFLLSLEALRDLTDVFGENPPGFQTSETCFGLNVYVGEVDSLHIYWDHLTQDLDAWRL